MTRPKKTVIYAKVGTMPAEFITIFGSRPKLGARIEFYRYASPRHRESGIVDLIKEGVGVGAVGAELFHIELF